MAAKKPNIVVIWGDDIGQSNISAYSDGVMGYRTPNIDRLAQEGMLPVAYGMGALLLVMGVLLIYADIVNPVRLL